jgi:RimJ/RimL family protein N-acetyltransferase
VNYRTTRTELRAPEQHDLTYLYGLLTHPSVAPHVRFRGTTVSPQEFAPALYEGALLVHLATARRTGRPIGLLMLHGASVMDGYVHLSMVAEPYAVGSGLLVEAGMAFLSHAFDTWPLRKVYIEATEDALRQYRSVVRRCGSEEGLLREHAYAEGRYQDVHLIAIYRADFESYRDTLLAGVVEPC